MVLGSCVSLQVGAASAAQLFPAMGSAGVTLLRLLVAAVLLLIVTRPHAHRWTRQQWTAVIAFGLDTLRLHRIEAQHETDNPASGRVMAHVGMQYEGTLRQRLKNKGRYVDVALYAILQGDPRP